MEIFLWNTFGMKYLTDSKIEYFSVYNLLKVFKTQTFEAVQVKLFDQNFKKKKSKLMCNRFEMCSRNQIETIDKKLEFYSKIDNLLFCEYKRIVVQVQNISY